MVLFGEMIYGEIKKELDMLINYSSLVKVATFYKAKLVGENNGK